MKNCAWSTLVQAIMDESGESVYSFAVLMDGYKLVGMNPLW